MTTHPIQPTEPEKPGRSAKPRKPAKPAEPGQSSVSALTQQLVDLAVPSGPNLRRRRQLLQQLIAAATDLAGTADDPLDLKIASTAVQEMGAAYRTFAPHRDTRKVTIFGSARTAPDDPLYLQTKQVAAKMAAIDWMVVTGAGPGIMAAGLDGAGRDHAIGVQIQLPFESEENPYVNEENLVEMRYFFTRKLALIRESQGFIVMPGGFGTLDEAFELLTLLQTGKATPVPIVMLGIGQGFWTAWEKFVDTVIEQGYASESDRSLYLVTNDVDRAVKELTNFYANFHSVRWVGDDLVMRMQRLPSPAQLATLNIEFAAVVDTGGIVVTDPLPPEVSGRDHLDLPRLKMRIGRRHPGRLRVLIDAINALSP
jgi:uncharacterized protein (TIGR00730 family)